MNPFGFQNAAMMGNMARMGRYGAMANSAFSSAPLSTPKAASALGGIASKASKLSFSSLLGGAQKGISTINQVIPLYNQVRPLIGNAKTMLNVFKSVGKSQANNDTVTEEPEIKVETPVKNNEATSDNVIFHQNKPNKPFFLP